MLMGVVVPFSPASMAAALADLGIMRVADLDRLRAMVEMAAHLGYSSVAINHVADFQDKKIEISKPICSSDLFSSFPIVAGKSKPINILTRLTIIAGDASHVNCFRASAEQIKLYDLVAVFPKTEKLFHTACTSLDVDLICITALEKQPFVFRRPPIQAAIERGLFFELVYTPSIRDLTMRRYSISNALSLILVCKEKNVILSSAAEQPLELRGPYDVAALGQLFGLSDFKAKAAISTHCRSALLHGETRKTAFGIVYTMSKRPAEEAKEEAKEESEPASKKSRPLYQMDCCLGHMTLLSV